MAKTARQARRARKKENRPKSQGQREDELVTEIWALDRMVGVRNVILQRLQDQLTPDERAALAEDPIRPFDYSQCAADLVAHQLDVRRSP